MHWILLFIQNLLSCTRATETADYLKVSTTSHHCDYGNCLISI